MALADALRQLAQLSPGIVAGLKGDGNAMKAFMDSYQQTAAQLDEQERQQQAMGMQAEDRRLGMEDRTRAITRQGEADARALEDRKRSQALQRMEIAPKLAEMGATADTPGDAQRIIEAALPDLMSAFGQETMAYGMPAVQMAEQTITSRQKAEVKRFLEDVYKSQFVADNPDSDPLLTSELIPPRIQKLLGRAEAKLSDVQRFVDTAPVGRPAGRPSDSVSLQPKEVLVGGKPVMANYNPKTGKYTDQNGQPVTADVIPPKATGDSSGIDSKGMARFNSIASAYDRSPLIRAADRTLILDDAAQNIRKDPNNAAAQMALAYGFIQTLDTYQSAVREGELGNLGSLGTVWQQLGVSANKLITTGAFMPPEVALQIADSADQMVQVIEKGRNQKMAEFASRAKVNKVEDMWNEFVAGMPQRAQAGGGGATKAAGGGSGVRVLSIVPVKKP